MKDHLTSTDLSVSLNLPLIFTARFATPIYNDELQRFDSNVRRRVEAPVQLKSPPRFLTVLDLPEYEFLVVLQ
jgi:hypothetical protein